MSKSKYYKHPTFGIVFGEDNLSPIGRLVWPALVTPKDPPPPQEGQQPGQPRYEITLLLDKENEKVKAFFAAMKTATDEMVALFNQGTKGATMTPARLFNDGDNGFDLEKYPYYAGKWVIAARNKEMVGICAADGVTKVEPKDVLGGLKGRLNLQPLITSHGISFKLKGIQVAGDDGQRFGGGTRDPMGLFSACTDDGEEAVSSGMPAVEAAEPEVKAPVQTKKGKEAMVNLL